MDENDGNHDDDFDVCYFRYCRDHNGKLVPVDVVRRNRRLVPRFDPSITEVFGSFGAESVTRGSHLEKLCLIREGVGRDNISDFTTNLIHEFLLSYTEKFAQKYIQTQYRRRRVVGRVHFNYETETWEPREYDLPTFQGDYVLLTPRDIDRKSTRLNSSHLGIS